MSPVVETSTPPNMPAPLGPYSHIARAGQFITISAIAGMDPDTGRLVGSDAYVQAKQILRLFGDMLGAAGSDFGHVVHVSVFLKDMEHLREAVPSVKQYAHTALRAQLSRWRICQRLEHC